MDVNQSGVHSLKITKSNRKMTQKVSRKLVLSKDVAGATCFNNLSSDATTFLSVTKVSRRLRSLYGLIISRHSLVEI